jgi:hypothetical protein
MIYTALGLCSIFFKRSKLSFRNLIFNLIFTTKTTSVAKMTKKYLNLITSLKIINEVMRLVWGNPLGY